MAGERYIEDLVIPASGSLTLASGATVSGSLVQGPASATDNAIARFDATTGKLLQNSAGILDDSGNLSGIGTVGCGTVTSTGNLLSGTSGYIHGKDAFYVGLGAKASNMTNQWLTAAGYAKLLEYYGGNDRRVIYGVDSSNNITWKFYTGAGAGSLAYTPITMTYSDGTVTIATPLKVTGIRAVTATGSASAQEIAHGTYTPTLTNGTNTAASTAYVCNTIRVGNIVTVTGRINVDPTSSATFTYVDISLPVASAMTVQDDLTGQGNTFGSAAPPTYQPTIIANSTNDRATLYYKPSDTNADDIFFTFTYIVK